MPANHNVISSPAWHTLEPDAMLQHFGVAARHGLTASGRYLVVQLLIPDRPGQLATIVSTIAEERANILAVAHHREGRNIGVLETMAELTLETRDEEHSQAVIQALVAAGYVVERRGG